LILGFLFLIFIFGWCVFAHSAETAPTKEKEKPDAASFISIKNKTPEQMFADANYLYQLGEYESALILFNKVATESTDKELKRKANMARELIDILTKAERIGGPKGEKEAKRADKIKGRQKQDQIAYLYKEAYSRFFSANYEQASEIFKAIIAIDPRQKEAKYYFQDRIPQLVKAEKVKSLYKEALQDFGIQDYEKAVKLFNEILVMSPEQKEIRSDIEVKVAFILKHEKINGLYEKANALFDSSDFEQAGKMFKEIIDLDPNQEKAREYLDVLLPQKMKKQRIAVLYKDALAAFNSQEYDKAKQLFYDILSLDLKQPEAKEYVEVKIPAVLKEKKIKGLLDDGVAAFNNQEYDKAQDMFNKVLALDITQPQALEYAQVKIPEVFNQLKIKDIYREAIEAFSVRDYERSDALFKDILALDNKQQQAKEYVEVKIPEKLKELKINALYSEALGYFNDRDFEKASDKFKEILALSPDDKEAREFAQVKIPAITRGQKISQMYAQAIDAFDNLELERSAEIFKAILAQDPSQEKAKEYLEVAIPQNLTQAKLQELYQNALFALNEADYESAIYYFEQILAIDPKQKQARLYLEEEIPNRLKIVKEEEETLRLEQAEKERRKAEKWLQQEAKQKQKLQEERERLIEERTARIQKEREKVLLAESKKSQVPPYEPSKRIERKERIKPSQPSKPSKPREQAGLAEQKKAVPEKVVAVKTRKTKYISSKGKPDYPKDGVIGYLYQRAFQAYDSGDYETAQDCFTKILIIEPEEAIAKDYLLKIMQNNG
jgi:tetratricopeptide (TPR) repeat protein